MLATDSTNNMSLCKNLKNPKKNVAIVGGGLVGSLASLYLAKLGHDVHVYEFRDDVRTAGLIAGRSINLALSARGRKALALVGLEEKLLEHGIPMHGRMIHDIDGKTNILLYDPHTKQSIYSIGRKHLNEVLIDVAEKHSNIHFHFNEKLTSAKLEKGKLNFTNMKTKETTEVETDLVVGCDGAFSTVRKSMLTIPGFDFNQTYIEHGYIELCIPPTEDDKFAMPHNYLHIWPRGQFMMIALPNQDKTWTVTLFMPFKIFASLTKPSDVFNFFKTNFPDAVPLIGETKLVTDVLQTKPQSLISVKCQNYHLGDNVLLMGDAAHAIVPFYGQGMNAGFEDCIVLDEILRNNPDNMAGALEIFSETRRDNLHTICDLAMYNYVEMRDLVNKKSYRWRKYVDDFLFALFPSYWIPLYNSVSFTDMPYKDCLKNRKWQDKILKQGQILVGSTSICIIGMAIFKYQHAFPSITSFNLFNNLI